MDQPKKRQVFKNRELHAQTAQSHGPFHGEIGRSRHAVMVYIASLQLAALLSITPVTIDLICQQYSTMSSYVITSQTHHAPLGFRCPAFALEEGAHFGALYLLHGQTEVAFRLDRPSWFGGRTGTCSLQFGLPRPTDPVHHRLEALLVTLHRQKKCLQLLLMLGCFAQSFGMCSAACC